MVGRIRGRWRLFRPFPRALVRHVVFAWLASISAAASIMGFGLALTGTRSDVCGVCTRQGERSGADGGTSLSVISLHSRHSCLTPVTVLSLCGGLGNYPTRLTWRGMPG